MITVTTTRKAITTQLREHCKAHRLAYDVTTRRGLLVVVIDSEELSPRDAADKYLPGGFDGAFSTVGATDEPPAGSVVTLFGTITPPQPTAAGLFDDSPVLAVTVDPAPPAGRQPRDHATVDGPGTGGELFALELTEGTPEGGFGFGVGDL